MPSLRIAQILAVATLLLTPTASVAQDFSLAAEYAKQVKRYPGIAPYLPEVDNVCAKLGVVYSTVDSVELRLDVFMPAAKGQTPMTPVVFVHGGGWSSGKRSLDAPMAMRLASAGLCVFCVDYRLSGVATYPAALCDVATALAWIVDNAKSFGIDPNRLTLIGSSAGGQMAALLGAANGSFPRFAPRGAVFPKIDRVVDIDGVLAFIHPDSSEGVDKPGKLSSATRWLGTPMAQDSALWREASALSHVGPGSARRFLFINSAQKRFSAGQAEMVSLLKSFGKEVEERKTENTPHTFWLFEPWAEDVARLIINDIENY